MIENLRKAAAALEELDPYERPAVEELYDLGCAISDVLFRLRRAVRCGMEPSVAALVEAANVDDPADAPVYDDEGRHPQDRLRTAWMRVRELDVDLARAVAVVEDYRVSAMSHIGPRSES